MTITHQEIFARYVVLEEQRMRVFRERTASYDKEIESLSELCGGIGHVPENISPEVCMCRYCRHLISIQGAPYGVG